MTSWSKPPDNNGGKTIGLKGQKRKVEVITAAGTRSSSKLATNIGGHPPTRK